MKNAERIAITVIVMAICLWFLSPTIKWYLFTSSQDKALVSYSSQQVKDYAVSSGNETETRQKIEKLKKTSSKAVQLGLDLKGGMSILLDVEKGNLSELEYAKAIDEDIEILKNRIDQYGVSEPEIRKQGTNQILIELAGTQNPERIDSFLKGKGNLSFHLADSQLTNKVRNYFSEHPQYFNEELYCPLMSSYPNKMLVGIYEEDDYGIDNLVSVMAVNAKPAIDGNYLVSADFQKDSMNRSLVTLKFTDEGGDIFYEFTRKNIGKTLTIVMDKKIRSAANIKEAIRSNVSIEGFSQQEAEDLAVLLKTANLPAAVSIASQQVVGATLGEDTVKAGLKAIALGLVLVIVFMVLFYGRFGFVADFALLLNLIMIVATLAGLGSTITLTGIAGIILTLGMAVDANVIIFERIKDELRVGNLPEKAVREGFSKALWTVLDGNITTIIAAIVLIVFGSSSVKGFATTLAIGIVCSLFTSLFVTHLLVDLICLGKHILRFGLLEWRKK